MKSKLVNAGTISQNITRTSETNAVRGLMDGGIPLSLGLSNTYKQFHCNQTPLEIIL